MEGGWMQPYVLTKILIKLVNLNFIKSGGVSFFVQKLEGFSLSRDILKSEKKLDSTLFLYTFCQYSYQ